MYTTSIECYSIFVAYECVLYTVYEYIITIYYSVYRMLEVFVYNVYICKIFNIVYNIYIV